MPSTTCCEREVAFIVCRAFVFRRWCLGARHELRPWMWLAFGLVYMLQVQPRAAHILATLIVRREKVKLSQRNFCRRPLRAWTSRMKSTWSYLRALRPTMSGQITLPFSCADLSAL